MGNITQMCEEANVNKAFEGGSEPQDHLYQPKDLDYDSKSKLNDFGNHTQIANLEKGHKWMKLKDGDEYYLGEWKDRVRKGQGVEVVPGKYIYQGSFDQDKHGRGKLVLLQHNVTYEGQFMKGRINGEGRVVHHQGHFDFDGKISQGLPVNGILNVYDPNTNEKKFTATLQEYPEQKAMIKYSDGRYYEGKINYKTFLPENQGVMNYPNGNTYEGNWFNGDHHGEGIFSWQDGSEYHGQYVHGVKQGRGKLTYSNKKVYNGQWVNGKQEGDGTLMSSQGKVINEGKWKEGRFLAEHQIHKKHH